MTQQQTKTAGLAIASLVMGITGYILTGPIGGLAAIICGHMAKSRIRDSEGSLEGDGLALAGLILGYVNLGVTVLLVIVIVPLLAAVAIPSFVFYSHLRAHATSLMHDMESAGIEIVNIICDLRNQRSDIISLHPDHIEEEDNDERLSDPDSDSSSAK